MTQPLEPTLELFPSPLARHFAATRPAFLTASLMACVIGFATAWHGGLAFDLPLVLITLLFALLAHAGVNVLNDCCDALNGTDAQNTQRIFSFTGGSRFIQNGMLTPAQTRNFGFAPMSGVAVAGLSYALLGTNLLYINQFPDRAADTAAGKLHWVARLMRGCWPACCSAGCRWRHCWHFWPCR